MQEIIQDLREDIMNSVDSSYAEYSEPEKEFLIENVKSVFIASDDYQYPELEDKILECVRFQFSEGIPQKGVLKTNIEAAILSWRHERSLS